MKVLRLGRLYIDHNISYVLYINYCCLEPTEICTQLKIIQHQNIIQYIDVKVPPCNFTCSVLSIFLYLACI